MSQTDPSHQSDNALLALGYHGTSGGGFVAFRPNIRRGEQLGFGIHFAADDEFANLYAFDPVVARKGGKDPRVVVGLVHMRRPLFAARSVVEGSAEFALAKKLAGPKLVTLKDEHGVPCCWLQNAIDAASPERAQKLIEEAGYDGVVYQARVGTQGVNARITAKSLSYLVFRPEQVTILGHRAAPRPRAATKLQCPDDIVWDDGDTENTLCARFGTGESHVRYTMDEAGRLRLLGIWRDRESDDAVRGADMVAWLKAAYGRKILVDEVAPSAIGFWDRMRTRKLISGYSDKPFSGVAYLPPEPAPMIGGRPVIVDASGRPQRFYLGSADGQRVNHAGASGIGPGGPPAYSLSPVVASVCAAGPSGSGWDYAEGSAVDAVYLSMNKPLMLSSANVNLGSLTKKLSAGARDGVPRRAMFETYAALVVRAQANPKDMSKLRVKGRDDLQSGLDYCRRCLHDGDLDSFDKELASVVVQASALAECPVFVAMLHELEYDGIAHRQPFEGGSRMAVLITGHQVAPEHIDEKRQVWMYRPLSTSQIAGACEFRARPGHSGPDLRDGLSSGHEAARRWSPG